MTETIEKNNPLEKFTPADLIKAYSQLVQKSDVLAADYKTRLAPLKQRMDTITNELLRRMEADGVTSFPTTYGRMTRKTHQDYSIRDLDTFYDHVFASKDLSYFGKSIQKPTVAAYIKQHGELPPGLAAFTKYSIAFTK